MSGKPVTPYAKLKRTRTKGGRNSDPKKLAWLRTRMCMVGRLGVCYGYVEAHHDRPMGAPATDKRTVPLCGGAHHREGPQSIEKLGRAEFERVHNINMDERTAFYETEWQERKHGS